MIPPFNEHGYLPPGIHKATIEEVAERFGWQSQMRRDEMESLRWLIALLKEIHVQRVILNGSFVTAEAEPNDVDCVLLADPDRDYSEEEELLEGLPFLEIDLVDRGDFDRLVEEFFATDRYQDPKGMIEVIL
jgi:predicted nucleotidyltransferase